MSTPDIRTDDDTRRERVEPVVTRTVAGRQVAVVRSRTAISSCLATPPPVVVLDLDAIDAAPYRVVSWTLQTARNSRVVLIDETDLPVSPLAVDAVASRPLTDRKLRRILATFDRRDRYADLLEEYERCVARLVDATADAERRALEERKRDLEARLAEFEASADDTTFGRTMREILQREEMGQS